MEKEENCHSSAFGWKRQRIGEIHNEKKVEDKHL